MRGILLWALGIPIPIIILLYLFHVYLTLPGDGGGPARNASGDPHRISPV